jgi:hypothetical protein
MWFMALTITNDPNPSHIHPSALRSRDGTGWRLAHDGNLVFQLSSLNQKIPLGVVIAQTHSPGIENGIATAA